MADDTADAMSDDAQEELTKLLLNTAVECPLPVLMNMIEVMVTVANRRLHDWVDRVEPEWVPNLSDQY